MNETPTNYQLLAVFVAVAEQASFTKASRKLGIGKGSVSRAITELEQQLGTELLHRTTRAVSLSTAGAALYERVGQHIKALDEALVELPERSAEPSGELRMTAPQDFGNFVLSEVLAQFARRYPQIRVDVRLTNARVDLVAEGFDLAIRAAPGSLKDSTLTARRLGSSSIGIFAAPSYIARRGKPKRFAEPGHEWILHTGQRAAAKRGADTPARFVSDDYLLLRDLARDGAGIAALPRFLVAPYVRDGLLEELTFADQPRWSGALFLVYPSSGQVPRKITAFRDFLIERLKGLLD
jgi:DNA-binding transcriptional LysR family regulator